MDDVIKQLIEHEQHAINYLIQATRLRMKLIKEQHVTDENILDEQEIIQIPFAAYEIQIERNGEERKEIENRHEKEKDKMRKHYRNIIIAICSVFAAFILSVFGIIIYLFANFDFAVADVYQYLNFKDGIGTIEDGITYDVNHD